MDWVATLDNSLETTQVEWHEQTMDRSNESQSSEVDRVKDSSSEQICLASLLQPR